MDTEMIATTGRTRIATTIGWLYPGNIVDGYPVEKVEHDNDGQTRFKLKGNNWTPWRDSTSPISCHL